MDDTKVSPKVCTHPSKFGKWAARSPTNHGFQLRIQGQTPDLDPAAIGSLLCASPHDGRYSYIYIYIYIYISEVWGSEVAFRQALL